MTTAEDLHTEREQRLAVIRQAEREAARLVVARLARREGMPMHAEDELLNMLGLSGEDDGTRGYMQAHVFNEPREHANLSAPVARGYR